jgi:hypothetical protein
MTRANNRDFWNGSMHGGGVVGLGAGWVKGFTHPQHEAGKNVPLAPCAAVRATVPRPGQGGRKAPVAPAFLHTQRLTKGRPRCQRRGVAHMPRSHPPETHTGSQSSERCDAQPTCGVLGRTQTHLDPPPSTPPQPRAPPPHPPTPPSTPLGPSSPPHSWRRGWGAQGATGSQSNGPTNKSPLPNPNSGLASATPLQGTREHAHHSHDRTCTVADLRARHAHWTTNPREGA